MNRTLSAALTASLLVPATWIAPVALQASQPYQPEQTIVVQSQRHTLDAWAGRLSQQISDNLTVPNLVGARSDVSGLVSVRFHCGPDGRPTALTITRRSGIREIDNAALRAIGKLNSLHPLPDEMTTGRSVRADIVFAQDQITLDRLSAKLNQERRAFARSGTDHSADLALTVSKRTSV